MFPQAEGGYSGRAGCSGKDVVMTEKDGKEEGGRSVVVQHGGVCEGPEGQGEGNELWFSRTRLITEDGVLRVILVG